MTRKAIIFVATWILLFAGTIACIVGYSALCIAVDSVAGAL